MVHKVYSHLDVAQDIQPLIESMDLEHSFMHVLDELSGHLEQFGEERQGGEEGQDDAELVRICCCWCLSSPTY